MVKDFSYKSQTRINRTTKHSQQKQNPVQCDERRETKREHHSKGTNKSLQINAAMIKAMRKKNEKKLQQKDLIKQRTIIYSNAGPHISITTFRQPTKKKKSLMS